MRQWPGLLLMSALAMLVAGCEVATPGRNPGPATSMANSAMEFRGERPCVDCEGIQAWLRLEQDGNRQSYRLVERYRGDGRERRFVDAGEWRAAGDLLRLHSSAGGERVYARLEDGSLQARDAHGQALPEAADDVLLPATFGPAR